MNNNVFVVTERKYVLPVIATAFRIGIIVHALHRYITAKCKKTY